MKTLKAPFRFDRNEFDRRVRIELYAGMEEEIEALLQKAVPLLNPKAVYGDLPVRKAGEGYAAGNVTFDDSVAIRHLSPLSRIFPYVVTCGTGLESMAETSGDMLEIFWLDALKQMAMDSAFLYFRSHIKREYAIDKLYSLNPGSDTCREGWDMANQRKIFDLLPGVEESAGVRLTESLLMHPNKTVSGLLFESDRDFVSCQECGNINCPNRRMIHDGALIT